MSQRISSKKKKGIRLSDKFHKYFNLDVVLKEIRYVESKFSKVIASTASHLIFLADEGLVHTFHDLKHNQYQEKRSIFKEAFI